MSYTDYYYLEVSELRDAYHTMQASAVRLVLAGYYLDAAEDLKLALFCRQLVAFKLGKCDPKHAHYENVIKAEIMNIECYWNHWMNGGQNHFVFTTNNLLKAAMDDIYIPDIYWPICSNTAGVKYYLEKC